MLAVLRWALAEMDRRYRLLETAHARDLETYNRKMDRQKGERLPRIVILIDELADMMMTAPDQTEHAIVRLAQMARATGIHLIVATQRPSADVITGLIKANFPTRISFTVASSVDSRVILDVNGAETLLGTGRYALLESRRRGTGSSPGCVCYRPGSQPGNPFLAENVKSEYTLHLPHPGKIWLRVMRMTKTS